MTAWDDKLLTNPHEVADKRSRVQKMFAAIAPSYDINNRLHSLWMDQRWRQKAVELSQVGCTDVIVDVACGTGDLALAYWRQFHDRDFTAWEFEYDDQVIGIDYTFEMLQLARRKSPFTSIQLGPRWLTGDATSLPLEEKCCNVVSIAFGIRNVQDVPTALKEFHRVLRSGGRVIILEFSLPTNPILRGLYNFYFRKILPITATLISRDKTGAYKYLPESVNTFIGRSEMMRMMRDAGFEQVEQFPLTFGVCVCYRGLKTAS